MKQGSVHGFYSWNKKTRKHRQTDRQTDRQKDRQTDRQTDKQTGMQTDNQTDRHADRQPDRQTDNTHLATPHRALEQARCSAVFPCRLDKAVPQPASIRASVARACPPSAARWRGLAHAITTTTTTTTSAEGGREGGSVNAPVVFCCGLRLVRYMYACAFGRSFVWCFGNRPGGKNTARGSSSINSRNGSSRNSSSSNITSFIPAMQAFLGVQQVLAPRRLQQSPDGVVKPEGGRQVEQILPPIVFHGDVVVMVQQQLQCPAVQG